MGILLVYDVTDEASFNNIRNWMRNIEQHASDNVNKVRCACLCLWLFWEVCSVHVLHALLVGLQHLLFLFLATPVRTVAQRDVVVGGY
jgi:hypothetical protein